MKQYQLHITVSPVSEDQRGTLTALLNDIDGSYEFKENTLYYNGICDAPSRMTDKQLFQEIVEEVQDVIPDAHVTVSGYLLGLFSFSYSTE